MPDLTGMSRRRFLQLSGAFAASQTGIFPAGISLESTAVLTEGLGGLSAGHAFRVLGRMACVLRWLPNWTGSIGFVLVSDERFSGFDLDKKTVMIRDEETALSSLSQQGLLHVLEMLTANTYRDLEHYLPFLMYGSDVEKVFAHLDKNRSSLTGYARNPDWIDERISEIQKYSSSFETGHIYFLRGFENRMTFMNTLKAHLTEQSIASLPPYKIGQLTGFNFPYLFDSIEEILEVLFVEVNGMRLNRFPVSSQTDSMLAKAVQSEAAKFRLAKASVRDPYFFNPARLHQKGIKERHFTQVADGSENTGFWSADVPLVNKRSRLSEPDQAWHDFLQLEVDTGYLKSKLTKDIYENISCEHIFWFVDNEPLLSAKTDILAEIFDTFRNANDPVTAIERKGKEIKIQHKHNLFVSALAEKTNVSGNNRPVSLLESNPNAQAVYENFRQFGKGVSPA